MKKLAPSRLAELPPTKWTEAKRRVAVVRRYLAVPDPSITDQARFADEIGVGFAMFHRIVRTVREWDALPDAARPHAHRRSVDPDSAELARTAVGLAGPEATQEAAYAKAVDLGRTRGVPPPGRQAVQTAYRRARAGDALAIRLGIDAEFVVDASPLGAATPREDGRAAGAVLSAIVDVAEGRLVRWMVTAGRADAPALRDLVRQSPLRGHASVGIASILPANELTDLRKELGLRPSRALRGGSVLSAALGERLGRIPLLPRTDPERPARGLPLVDPEDLRDAVGAALAAADL